MHRVLSKARRHERSPIRLYSKMKEKFVMKLFSLCVTTTNEESPLWTPVSPYFGCITNQRGEGNDFNLYSSQPTGGGSHSKPVVHLAWVSVKCLVLVLRMQINQCCFNLCFNKTLGK